MMMFSSVMITSSLAGVVFESGSLLGAEGWSRVVYRSAWGGGISGLCLRLDWAEELVGIIAGLVYRGQFVWEF